MLDEVKIYYVNDDAFKLPFENLPKEFKSIEEIEQFKSYDLRDGILYYNIKACILKVDNYRVDIMHDLHVIPIAIHPSFKYIYGY